MTIDRNAESYSQLLNAMATGEDSAAAAYLKLRETLVRFFLLKGDEDADASADETLQRVAVKISEGVVIECMTKYAFGVARFVFLENLRRAKRTDAGIKKYRAEIELYSSSGDTDSYVRMRECFGALSEANRKLLQEYFADVTRDELDRRRRLLAVSMGATVNNLRLKVFRLRRKLEDCLRSKS